MLLIITSNSDKLFIDVNVDDFEPQNRVLVNFWRFPAASHILKVNCTEMAGDGPGLPAYGIFSIEHTFLKNSSFELLNLSILSKRINILLLYTDYQSGRTAAIACHVSFAEITYYYCPAEATATLFLEFFLSFFPVNILIYKLLHLA